MYEPEHATLADAPDKVPSIGERVWQRAMKWLHGKRTLTPDMLAEQPASDMIAETNRVFAQALNTGIEYAIPDAMRQKLEHDVFVFSGCKSYIKLKEASLLLTDRETGKVKPFDRFYKDVIGIHKTYDKQYLQAEYHYAVGASQMAAKWAKFEADGDRYDLQYRTAKDERVRDTHARLADTTLPLSDPFWNSFTPPLGWRCRCTVVQVRRGKYPHSDSREKQAIAEGCTTGKLEMFRYNPGKQQVVFPPHHPYYKVMNGIGDVLGNLAQAKTANVEKSRQQYERYGEEWEKAGFDEDSGGYMVIHKHHNTNTSGWKYEQKAGELLIKQGKQVEFLSEEGTHTKHPDLGFDEKTWDVKGITNAKVDTYRKYIKDAEKADNALFVLENHEHFTILQDAVERSIGYYKSKNKLEKMPGVYYFNQNGQLKSLYK